MRLKDIVGDAVLKFKSDKIIIIRKEIMALLEDAVKANDIEKVILLQKRYANLSVALGPFQESWGTGYYLDRLHNCHLAILRILKS